MLTSLFFPVFTRVACVSSADTNAEESLNTLKYANRARNIQNKAVINRDPMAAQMQRMRNQIELLQSEVLFLRGDSTVPHEELQILKHKISLIEASNAELQRELQERQISCDHLAQKAQDAQMERDKLVMKIESARGGKPWNEIDSDANQDFDLVKSYVSKIQELEGELIKMQTTMSSRIRTCADYNGFDDNGPHSDDHDFVELDMRSGDLSSEFEVEEKAREHSSLQEQLNQELKELDKRLEQKEVEMKRFGNMDTSVLKQHYEKKVQELQMENRVLQELRHNLASISSTLDDGAQKLKQDYLQELNMLEAQVGELKKKQDAQAQLLRQKQKRDDAVKRLHDEIHKIKIQKVQLQQKIKQESEQFRLWKASREKEVLQLKKEGRRNEYEMHKLLALNQRQKMVLQRNTEEAALATKHLKELLVSKKTSCESGVGHNGGTGIRALMQAIEHELEVTVGVHEVRAGYERQMEERARMAKELSELKEEAQIARQGELRCGYTYNLWLLFASDILVSFGIVRNCVMFFDCSSFTQTMSAGARNSRIFALENMLATSSSALVAVASHLSEAEEHERAFSGKGRWNQVRTLAEAKYIMNFLFNLASSSRCKPKDCEVDCREKDSEIRDLKEKVVKLLREIDLQKAEINRQEKLLKCANRKQTNEAKSDEGYYGLRPRGIQNSVISCGGGNSVELLEDMDTSDSGHSDMDQDDEEYKHESEMDANDDINVYSTKTRRSPPTRKKSPNNNPSGSVSLPVFPNDSEGLNPQGEGGEVSLTQKIGSVVCCSCSKNSQCKTPRCECRAAEGCCGMACKCNPEKCANRETRKKESSPFEAEAVVGASEETGSSSKLLETNEDGAGRRKPLSDIENTLDKSDAPKPTQRKKGRKPTIILVPFSMPKSFKQ